MHRSKICLPDINVWVALWWDGHTHHRPAKEWFASLDRCQAAFCRVTQMGFLRLITNPRLMREDVRSAGQAWDLCEKVMADPRVFFLPEAEAVETAWKRFTRLLPVGTGLWTDAYLAAFASIHGLTLVSFDRGFRGLDGVGFVLLAPPSRA